MGERTDGRCSHLGTIPDPLPPIPFVLLRRFLLVALAAWLACAGNATAAEQSHPDPRASVDYYLRTHGRVSPTRIPEVYAVFTRVLQVADKTAAVTPELIVVDDRQQAAAFVLADGSIVLSQRALDLIGTDVERAEADARLAFVLGHELAHLADNDFWDHQLSESLLRPAGTRGAERTLASDAAQQQKELEADDQGFLYAALAGYRVDALIRASDAHSDFLSAWSAQMGARDAARYPSPASRIELLRARLAERNAALENFRFGVRLLHFGRYREGIALLREFQRQFPSREVFNNLGYGYLHLALGQLPPEQAYHYWLPTWSDLQTPLSRLSVRGRPASGPRVALPAPVRENLLHAVSLFERALGKDARYVPAYLNLASAQLLLGMAGSPGITPEDPLVRAELAVSAAQALAPDDPRVRVVAAIVAFERRRDNSIRTVSIETNDATLAYDLARVHAGTAATAQRYWRQVVGQFEGLPPRLQDVLCREPEMAGPVLAVELVEHCGKVSRATAANPLKPSPLQLGRDLLDKPLTATELARHPWQIGTVAGGKVFTAPDATVLALDDITMLAVVRERSDTASLLRASGQPHERIAVTGGTLWHYGTWIALVRDESVDELWLAD